jgi:sterol desaturase/sphingolipid hydroxylase (fatty acid hydroxylase superfamily)
MNRTNNLGTVFTFWDKFRGTLDVTKYAEDQELGNGDGGYPQRWFRAIPETSSRLLKN